MHSIMVLVLAFGGRAATDVLTVHPSTGKGPAPVEDRLQHLQHPANCHCQRALIFDRLKGDGTFILVG